MVDMTNKTGTRAKGRLAPASVPDAEDALCVPATERNGRPTNHRLTSRDLTTGCDGCGASWAQIDAELRVEAEVERQARKHRRRR